MNQISIDVLSTLKVGIVTLLTNWFSSIAGWFFGIMFSFEQNIYTELKYLNKYHKNQRNNKQKIKKSHKYMHENI